MSRSAGRLTAGVAVCVAAVVCAAVPLPEDVVERWFSLAWYPLVQRVLTPATNLLPLAVLDGLIVVALAGVTAWALGAWRATRQGGWVGFGSHVGWLVVATAALYLVFLTCWGFNYQRIPMSSRLVLDGDPPDAAAVEQLGLDAAARLNELWPAARTTDGDIEPWRNAPLRAAFDEVQRALSEAPPATPGRLKQTMLGPYFTWVSVDGMINPFGLEVLANPEILPFERPFVAAHEWAHLAGYADESEANFVGWLTCLRAAPLAQYSGWLHVFSQVSGALGAGAAGRMSDALDPGPRADLAAIGARVRASRIPALSTRSWQVYDRYLRANRVPGGVRNYGAVVTLILQTRFEDGWRPVRRPR
ncbi:MAG: DUF3810 family protein [Vicinamibacterales bacterium]